MRIRDILRTKGTDVVTVTPQHTVLEAMRVLVEHNIGAVVVVDGTIEGIISERDVLRLGADDPQKLTATRVRDAMTSDVITAEPGDDIEEVMATLTENRIRHLPIAENGRLVGIISIGDVVNALRKDVELENQQLHAYITGGR